MYCLYNRRELVIEKSRLGPGSWSVRNLFWSRLVSHVEYVCLAPILMPKAPSGNKKVVRAVLKPWLHPSPLMSKRIRIYTAEDVADHAEASSCWVSRAGKVYDVTSFLNDHPGGDDLILQHAGKDIEEVMKDKLEHEHSDSAYNMLDEYVIGRLGNAQSIVREGTRLNSAPS